MAIYAEATEGRAQLAAGTYEVTCTDVQEDELENVREPLVWRFFFETEDTLDGNGNPMTIDGIASRYLTPNSKAWAWCEALGMTLEVGERHNLEDAIGGKALAKVVVKPGRDGGRGFARIETIMPLPKKGTKAPTRPQEARQPSAPFDTDTDPAIAALSAWWGETRKQGFERKDVLAKCEEVFPGKEPAGLTPAERATLMTNLTT